LLLACVVEVTIKLGKQTFASPDGIFKVSSEFYYLFEIVHIQLA